MIGYGVNPPHDQDRRISLSDGRSWWPQIFLPVLQIRHSASGCPFYFDLSIEWLIHRYRITSCSSSLLHCMWCLYSTVIQHLMLVSLFLTNKRLFSKSRYIPFQTFQHIRTHHSTTAEKPRMSREIPFSFPVHFFT